MRCVILAGGKGSRLSEYTTKIPKPMVKIGGRPILDHIINYYKYYGVNEFIIAGGYKYKIISDYYKRKKKNLQIKVINTGLNTLTGKRIKLLEKLFYKNENFYLTYGDGLSNVNLNKVFKLHNKKKAILTLTAVHPPARFGELKIKNENVIKFKEKPQLNQGWINGGFFVANARLFKILNKKNVMLERDPVEKIVKMKKAASYQHKGFWYCMDNLRDKNVLEELIKKNKAPWIKK
jgi:glucose-1-phosphate cytidylyltransferase